MGKLCVSSSLATDPGTATGLVRAEEELNYVTDYFSFFARNMY